MKKALIIVDVQNDFCEGGSLAVPFANDIISKINNLMKSETYDLIVATLDCHPENHSSFVVNDPNGIWPVHCVAGSIGYQLHKDLEKERINAYINKGMNKNIDSYSGFFDNDKVSKTGLEVLLKSLSIESVDVVGLALDYCVSATALDAQELGFKTTVIKDCTRAVNIQKDDEFNTLINLKDKGVLIK